MSSTTLNNAKFGTSALCKLRVFIILKSAQLPLTSSYIWTLTGLEIETCVQFKPASWLEVACTDACAAGALFRGASDSETHEPLAGRWRRRAHLRTLRKVAKSAISRTGSESLNFQMRPSEWIPKRLAILGAKIKLDELGAHQSSIGGIESRRGRPLGFVGDFAAPLARICFFHFIRRFYCGCWSCIIISLKTVAC